MFLETGLLEADTGNGVERNVIETSYKHGVRCVWRVYLYHKICLVINSDRRNGRV